MHQNVPFVSNTPDNLHCVQASFLIILKNFIPNIEIDWDDWQKMTGFEEGKGTWPTAGLIWFIKNKFDVRHIESFDFNKFALKGELYLSQVFSDAMFESVAKDTNFEMEQDRAQELSTYGVCENRAPTAEDIKRYLGNGYLVRAHVNAKALNRQSGYAGHSVVVFGYDDSSFMLHDPGLPAAPNMKVDFTDFEKAFLTDGPDSGEIDAIKLS